MALLFVSTPRPASRQTLAHSLCNSRGRAARGHNPPNDTVTEVFSNLLSSVLLPKYPSTGQVQALQFSLYPDTPKGTYLPTHCLLHLTGIEQTNRKTGLGGS